MNEQVKILKQATGIIPGLSVILIGNDPASNVYVKSKQKAAIEIGMNAVDYLAMITCCVFVVFSIMQMTFLLRTWFYQ